MSTAMNDQNPDPRARRAVTRFEAYLAERGESVCLASLPAAIDEIAADAGFADRRAREDLVAALRSRAGLHV